MESASAVIVMHWSALGFKASSYITKEAFYLAGSGRCPCYGASRGLFLLLAEQSEVADSERRRSLFTLFEVAICDLKLRSIERRPAR